MTEDEIVDIPLYSIPNSWNNEMARQGFDPYERGINSLITFCEQMEMAEEFTPVRGDKKDSNKRNKRSSGGDCALHGANCGHSSADCRTLKKMKSDEGNNHDRKDRKSSGKKSQNKSWSRKADEAKQATKKSLATFIRKTIREEMNAIEGNKRKSDDEDEEESSVETGDLNMAEHDFENMSLDDAMNNLKNDSDFDEIDC